MSWTRTRRRAERLRRRPDIEGLEIRCVLSTGSTTSQPAFDPLIGASAVRQDYGVTGVGLSAAVIDTGVNYHLAALGGGFGTGQKVVAGLDLADNTPDPAPVSGDQHGTEVAGLLASNDPAHPGVAPGANIVALRVFNQNDQSNFEYIAQALQWVLANHSQYNITVVNISVSDNRNYTLDWFSNDGGVGQQIAGLVHQLKQVNIPVVAATGNAFAGQQGQGFVSILPETISVTGTDLTDHFEVDAQRLGTAVGGPFATDLAAPSVGLQAPQNGNTFGGVSGTSFAAPLVSGGIILLQSIYEQRFHTLPSVDQLVGWLKGGSDPVYDPVTGITVGRLDLAKAAALIPPAPTPPPPPPVEQALTQLYQDGKLVGSVPANDPANPLRDALAAFGLQGTIKTASTWSAAANPLKNAFAAFGLTGSFQKVTTWNASAAAIAQPTPAASTASQDATVRVPAASRPSPQPVTVASSSSPAPRGWLGRLMAAGRRHR
jgi:hypothetical protein